MVLQCGLSDPTPSATANAPAVAEQRALLSEQPLGALSVGPLSLEALANSPEPESQLSSDIDAMQPDEAWSGVPARINKRHWGCGTICTARVDCYVNRWTGKTLVTFKKSIRTRHVTKSKTRTTKKVVFVSGAAGSCDTKSTAQTTCQVARNNLIAGNSSVDMKAIMVLTTVTKYGGFCCKGRESFRNACGLMQISHH